MATGDPVARRIIFGTHVVPTYSIEGEEKSVRHTEFQPDPAGTFGGKGVATIDEDQWGDGWTSFNHQGAYWEDQSDVWELLGEVWDGILAVTAAAPLQLTANTDPCKFLYIKNTGSIKVLVALDGGTNYYIVIPVNGSIALRGDGTQLLCSEVYVKAESAGTTMEFIIAI